MLDWNIAHSAMKTSMIRSASFELIFSWPMMAETNSSLETLPSALRSISLNASSAMLPSLAEGSCRVNKKENESQCSKIYRLTNNIYRRVRKRLRDAKNALSDNIQIDSFNL